MGGAFEGHHEMFEGELAAWCLGKDSITVISGVMSHWVTEVVEMSLL